MKETDWVKSIINKIEKSLRKIDSNLRVVEGRKLPYSDEILVYNSENLPKEHKQISYETDILVYEMLNEKDWKPRIIIETKVNKISTHTAITYSQKAKTHKNVHPYLRYGILIGNRSEFPLPGRLFRHGEYFDFMLSWKDYIGTQSEWKSLIKILKLEYQASKCLDDMIYNSRSPTRLKLTSLHKPLLLD